MSEKTCPECGQSFHPKGFPTHQSHCSEEEREKLERLYWDEGLSTNQIGDRIGMTNAGVLGKMEKYGIETRSPGEGKRLRHQHEVQTYWAHGRMWIKIGEYGDDFAFPVAKATALADYSLEEMKGMDVHHMNDHPADDRPSNLELLDHAEHSSLTNS